MSSRATLLPLSKPRFAQGEFRFHECDNGKTPPRYPWRLSEKSCGSRSASGTLEIDMRCV